MHKAVLILGFLTASVAIEREAAAQTDPNSVGPAEQIDACGILVRVGNCVLFEGAGGRWFVPDTGRFDAGEAVRVVGLADPACVTICAAADGCVRGAVVLDPVSLPCGTPLPDFPGDICTGVAAGLSGLAVAGLWYTRRATERGRRSDRACGDATRG